MTLKFFTLGCFTLFINERAVPRSIWGTHRAATLCKILLTYRGQRLHKEQIQDWIWPEVAPEAASRNLRVALSELRRILEPDRVPRGESHYIVNGGNTVSLGEEEVWIDNSTLSQAIELDPTEPETLARLKAALALYRGVYLPDDLYADWALAERERLAQTHETAFYKLAQAYGVRSNYHEAIRICRQALVTYPTSESLVELLIRYALEVGQTTLALKAYKIYAQTLAIDLQLTPSPPLAALARDIQGALPQTPVPDEARPLGAYRGTGRTRRAQSSIN